MALAWFATYGFDAHASGDLIGIANAKNIPLQALFDSGVFQNLHGKAALTPRDKLPEDWSPATDRTPTVWECVQHTARVLRAEDGGSEAAARLVAGMGSTRRSRPRARLSPLRDRLAERLGRRGAGLQRTGAGLDGPRRPSQRAMQTSRRPMHPISLEWLPDEQPTSKRSSACRARSTICASASRPIRRGAHEGAARRELALLREQRGQCADPRRGLDEYGLLKTMIDNWRDVFEDGFPRTRKEQGAQLPLDGARSTQRDGAPVLPLQDNEALRYLDAIEGVLRAVKAPGVDISEAKRLYEEQRRSGLAVPTAAAEPAPARPRRSRRTKARQGAAAVDRGRAAASRRARKSLQGSRSSRPTCSRSTPAMPRADYATPRELLQITFLTEGLKRVLLSALQRLSGRGGDPVIGLQTSFGGGKTHTLLSVYHLARHLSEGGNPARLARSRPTCRKARPARMEGAEARRVRRLGEGHRRVADAE